MAAHEPPDDFDDPDDGVRASPAAIGVSALVERWPLAEPFVIARGTKTEAEVVVVLLSRRGIAGRGECVPYARYGETTESVLAQIAEAVEAAGGGPPSDHLPPGAARNALDCALWDLHAKESGVPPAEVLGLAPLRTVETCYTLSLGTPDAMAAKARTVPHLKLLKLKLGGAGDDQRMAAVRAARPDARLVADANEAWTAEMLAPLLEAARAAGLEVVEQPLPAALDAALAGLAFPRPVPICADESAHTSADLSRLARLYDAVNIKLDKTGGLSEALEMQRAAERLGLAVMVGCMVASSLALAPAVLLAQRARWVDLDGPLLLAKDRDDGLVIRDGWIAPPSPALWG